MTQANTNRVAVIMAGGAGERFWPYSRRLRPKQILRLGADKPILAETIERMSTLIPREQVLIVAGEYLRDPHPPMPGTRLPVRQHRRPTDAKKHRPSSSPGQRLGKKGTVVQAWLEELPVSH